MDAPRITLENLYSPAVKGILKGQVLNNEQTSLFRVVNEAKGWQNWLEANQVPFEGTAYDSAHNASQVLNLENEFQRLWPRVEPDTDLRPSAHFKGGDVACWQKVAGLDYGVFQQCCPGEVQADVVEAIKSHSKQQPHRRDPPQERVRSDHHPPPVQPLQVHQVPDGGESNSSPKPGGGDVRPGQARDLYFAELARTIVGVAGTQYQDQRTLEGKTKYRISLNLTTNTLQVFSKDRGEMPILLDENGNIDHKKSRVSDRDVQAFQTALAYLRQAQQTQHGGKTPGRQEVKERAQLEV